MLPTAYNPLLGRLCVVVAIWTIVPASYANPWVRRNVRVLWSCGLWLLTAHYFYLFYENPGRFRIACSARVRSAISFASSRFAWRDARRCR